MKNSYLRNSWLNCRPLFTGTPVEKVGTRTRRYQPEAKEENMPTCLLSL
jgi:hypothetical protein